MAKPNSAKALRLKLDLNQSEFWGRVYVTQSGGSRYESGREVPTPIQALLEIAYGNKKQSTAAVSALRKV